MVERFFPKKISQLEENEKICVIGKVSQVLETSFIIEDESGEIEVLEKAEGLEEGEIVRIFGETQEGRIKPFFIQKLKGIDLNLFKRLEKLYSEVENV